jgi:hypothetical protein
MCQKMQITKQFFIVLTHPFPLQKALVVGVVKQTPQTQAVFEGTRNSLFLTPSQVQSLGFTPPKAKETYMVPFQIPRDWFLH